ncbi:energy-coupling factor transporter transmembrane protein EcfT [Micrococcus sp. FDAARGOS_333]|uniref:energy-coupling factor transporter transmembrane protein EcfT n=1 Tax=Micrococcus sp. FDAARGOS_333 TaxID=1930558 RepID=UPI001D116981|nr:energy-coupling factor transporter transmembrane protein EcfT [Micrococcus sp. FDAARGOS_333]
MAVFAVWALVLAIVPATLWTAAAAVAGALACYLVGFGAARGVRMLAADLRSLWLFYAMLLPPSGSSQTSPRRWRRRAGARCGARAQVMTRTTRIAAMTAVAEALVGRRLVSGGGSPWRGRFPAGRVGCDGPGAQRDGYLRGLADQVRAAQASRACACARA